MQKSNSDPSQPELDRRSPNRTRDDADWESKVLRRVSGRVRELTEGGDQNGAPGWEASVLDVLRGRIERESK